MAKPLFFEVIDAILDLRYKFTRGRHKVKVVRAKKLWSGMNTWKKILIITGLSPNWIRYLKRTDRRLSKVTVSL